MGHHPMPGYGTAPIPAISFCTSESAANCESLSIQLFKGPMELPQRTCKNCGETKATSEFERRRTCKKCRSAQAKERQSELRSRSVINTPDSKRCSTCGNVKSRNAFSPNKKCVDGLQYQCRQCAKQSKKLHKQRAFTSTPVNYKMQCMLEAARIRDKQRGWRCDLTHNWLMATFGAVQSCPILGIELDWKSQRCSANSPTLDAINPDVGHVMGNVQIISHKANTMKSNATLDELYSFGKWAAAEMRKIASFYVND